MNAELTLSLAFATGVFGALHCLGMCSGIAGGFFVRYGHNAASVLQYQAARILVYGLLGVGGAVLGKVLVQTGVIGKGQGLLMMTAGVIIAVIGLDMLDLLPESGRERQDGCKSVPGGQDVSFPTARPSSRPWRPILAGALNGMFPCSLVFSIAVKAAATANPPRAGLLMLAFGLGTLPTMGLVGLTGMAIGRNARGASAKLAGLAVVALGAWTLYEGWVFFDVMRGLSN
jgi:sulfite exporter TauE/SafE